MTHPAMIFFTRTKYCALGLGWAVCAANVSFAAPTQTPLDIATAAKPNVMVLLDTSGSMKNSNRWKIAKTAIYNLFDQTSNVRFCFSSFTIQSGADIPAGMKCSSTDTDKATLKSTVYNLTVDDFEGSTPVAESHYDITRFFRGQAALFGLLRVNCLSCELIHNLSGFNLCLFEASDEPDRIS